ncbi:ribokinase [Pararhizobium mangrovi]|nr:ribokinase [Pararhizobium mangrovi]
MLTVFGSINIDQVVRVKAFVAAGETVIGERVGEFHGGKGANQVVAAARVAADRTEILMVGCVGADELGANALTNLRENGVKAECEAREDSATGTAWITIDETGENAITVLPGANAKLAAERIPYSVMAATTVLLCQGEVQFRETARAVARVRELRSEATIIVNLAPVPSDMTGGDLESVLIALDVLIVNSREADQVEALTERQLSEIGRELSFSTVVTRGSEGALIYDPQGGARTVPSLSTQPVDTTGAGDTFCGTLAALLAEGMSLHRSVYYACRAGSLACGQVGAQAAMPSRAEVLDEADG